MIFLDVDGVLADFAGGACALHGRPNYAVTSWDWYEAWGYSARDFWQPIERAGLGFYPRYVRPYPWHAELLRLVKSHGEFVIATASPLHPGLVASKVEWIREYVGADVSVMIGDRKDLLASRDHILIDDSDKNVKQFRERGGLAVPFPQPWNANHGITKHRLGYLDEVLAIFTGRTTAA